MTRTNEQFASVDLDEYIEGLSRLMREYVERGYKAYITTFMFRSLPISERASKQVMLSEVMRVYGRFLKAAVRYPRSKQSADRRPVFIGCPDWPVPKAIKRRLYTDSQSGIHYAGMLLVPRNTRLKTGVRRHFREERKAYIRSPGALARIHLKRVKDDIDRATRYSFKAIKRRSCGIDDILVLPRSRAERPA